MKLRVLGCHGGTSVRHRNVSFLIGERLALEAGALAAGLTLEEQAAVEHVLVSHSHMDHVADLGTLVDLSQQAGTRVTVHSVAETIEALGTHFFNDVLWPDFTRLPTTEAPTLRLRALAPEEPVEIGGLRVRPVRVDHSVPSCGFVVEDGSAALAYSGDTGPTERFWTLAAETPNLSAVITEVSYPDRMAELARVSGHLTPSLFDEQIARLGDLDVPILVYGMKPLFEDEIRGELERFGDRGVRALAAGEVLALG